MPKLLIISLIAELAESRFAASVLVTGANRGQGLEWVRQLVFADEPPEYVFAGCRHPNNPLVSEQ